MKHMTITSAVLFVFVFLLSLPSYASDTTDLIKAVENGDIVTARTLLTKGVDANAKRDDGVPALHLAILKGHLEVVSTLIQHGADPNLKVSGWDSLAVAFSSPSDAQREIILYLIDHGVNLDPPAGSPSPLMGAISSISSNSDAIAIVGHILAAKFNPDHQDGEGKTALMYASERGYLNVVTGLLSKHANVNLRDKQGRTALMYVAMSYNGNTFSLTNPKDPSQKVRVEHCAVAQELLSHGADVQVIDKQGMNALDYAEKATVFAPSDEATNKMRALLRSVAAPKR